MHVLTDANVLTRGRAELAWLNVTLQMWIHWSISGLFLPSVYINEYMGARVPNACRGCGQPPHGQTFSVERRHSHAANNPPTM